MLYVYKHIVCGICMCICLHIYVLVCIHIYIPGYVFIYIYTAFYVYVYHCTYASLYIHHCVSLYTVSCVLYLLFIFWYDICFCYLFIYIYTYIYADLIYSVSFYISPYFTYIVALPSPCMPNQALKFPPGQACLRRLAAQSGNVDAIGAAFSHRWQIIV